MDPAQTTPDGKDLSWAKPLCWNLYFWVKSFQKGGASGKGASHPQDTFLWYFKGKAVNSCLRFHWRIFLPELWKTSLSNEVWSCGSVDPPGKPVKCLLGYQGKYLQVGTCTEASASALPPGYGLIMAKVFRDLAWVVTSRWPGGRGRQQWWSNSCYGRMRTAPVTW